MTGWTQREYRALEQLNKAFAALPSSVILYTSDGEITAFKKNVPSDDLQYGLIGRINPGVFPGSLHDEFQVN